jgi:ribosomal protein S12 methylthiotransferase
VPRRFWIETLGCPKNQVDSDKLTGLLHADGLAPAASPDGADVIVVNTCAFVEEARQESIDTILALADVRRDGARLVVTGCLAERYGDELAAALPEADAVVGFGQALLEPVGVSGPAAAPADTAVPVALGPRRRGPSTPTAPPPAFDLLNLPRPRSPRPWAYVKVAEGCDRACGFCAIPSFRGPQRSRDHASILAEVDALEAAEIVLVAQDLASFGRDQGKGEKSLVPLVRELSTRVARVRLLYLYPSELDDELIDTILGTGVAYFDLSLQHASRPLLRRMKRWGDGDRFLERIGAIRAAEAQAAFRSNFIVGYPGETEADHDRLLAFVRDAQLDWCGFFSYSAEPGTYAADLDGVVPDGLVAERLAELRELQDAITARRREALLGEVIEVLVDEPGIGRSHREAPEIDGIISVPASLTPGTFARVRVIGAEGPDLEAALIEEEPAGAHPVGGAR